MQATRLHPVPAYRCCDPGQRPFSTPPGKYLQAYCTYSTHIRVAPYVDFYTFAFPLKEFVIKLYKSLLAAGNLRYISFK